MSFRDQEITGIPVHRAPGVRAVVAKLESVSSAILFYLKTGDALVGAASVDRNDDMKQIDDNDGVFNAGEGFLTKQQMAHRFHRTGRTIEVWMRNGILPFLKVGRSVFFQLDDVQRHLEQHFRRLNGPARKARPRTLSRTSPEGVTRVTAEPANLAGNNIP